MLLNGKHLCIVNDLFLNMIREVSVTPHVAGIVCINPVQFFDIPGDLISV